MHWIERMIDRKIGEDILEETIKFHISFGHCDSLIDLFRQHKCLHLGDSVIRRKVKELEIDDPADSEFFSALANYILDHWKDEGIKQRRGGN